MKTEVRPRQAIALRLVLLVVICAFVAACGGKSPKAKPIPKPPTTDIGKVPPIDTTTTRVTVQKKCPLEGKIRAVPSWWGYCPYDGAKLETTSLPKNADTLNGSYVQKYCTDHAVNIPANSSWNDCPEHGAHLQ